MIYRAENGAVIRGGVHFPKECWRDPSTAWIYGWFYWDWADSSSPIRVNPANREIYPLYVSPYGAREGAPYIYCTKNFLDWKVGFHNPIMMYGDDDRRVKPGCTLSPEDLDLLENGLNINCSDLDLCEFEGKTRIYYANGDQMTYSFLCEAEYDGPLSDFLKAFFY